MSDNPFIGNWTYRSFLNDPDINKSFNDLEFGVGTIVIEEAPMQTLKGTIGGSGWSLVLKGARQYGDPPPHPAPGSATRCTCGSKEQASSTGRSGSTTTKAISCHSGRTALTRFRRLLALSCEQSRIQAASPARSLPPG